MGKSKATLADVSKLAGVSSATASRVINGTGPVSDDVRARIEAAMASLEYEPRKSLASKDKDGVIAVLTGDLMNPYFSEIVRGVQDEADNYEMILTLYNLTDHPHRQRMLIQKLSRQSLNGIIIMGTHPFPALIEWQQKQQIPMVVINRTLCLPYVHCISVDFENAMYRATQHLLTLGHTRIGYISAFHNSDIAAARRRGIDLALTEAGLSLNPKYCATVPQGTEVDGGYQAMATLVNRPIHERPTGVLAFNDVVSIGALHAARVHGVRVPQDFSIIGVDDIFTAMYTSPPLTTVGQPKFRMGMLAVQRIQSMSQGDFPDGNYFSLLESPLIVRESTGPAPANS